MTEFFGVDVRAWPDSYKRAMHDSIPSQEAKRFKRWLPLSQSQLSGEQIYWLTYRETGSRIAAEKAEMAYMRAMLASNRVPT